MSTSRYIVAHEYYYLQAYHEHGMSGWKKSYQEFDTLEGAEESVRWINEQTENRRNPRVFVLSQDNE